MNPNQPDEDLGYGKRSWGINRSKIILNRRFSIPICRTLIKFINWLSKELHINLIGEGKSVHNSPYNQTLNTWMKTLQSVLDQTYISGNVL
jgi:hypothetical protein